MRAKLILTSLFLAVIALPAHANLSVRTNPLLREAAFLAVQARLCADYRPKTLRSCLRAGDALRSIISFSRPFRPADQARLATAFNLPIEEAKEIKGTAIHTDRLASLLSNPRTLQYLQEITFRRRYDPEFNLWKESVKSSSSAAEALERVAVLFQDLSSSREHLTWAIAKGVPEAVIAELAAANDPMIQELQIGFVGAKRTQQGLKRYYPYSVGNLSFDALTPGAYHFYSAAYWVYRLRKMGVSREHAILQAFGVHLAYEVSGTKKNFWPIGNLPEKITSRYKAEDLTSAYWGAVYGASLADHQKFGGQAGLATAFERDFRGAIRSLLAPAKTH